MIVVEGMDNSGKTTLVQSLGYRLMLPVQKSPVELLIEERYNDWYDWIETSLSPDRDHYIYDRYPIFGEYVYGPLLRGSNLLENKDYRNRWLNTRPLIIYCRPSLDRILNFGERSQMDGVKSNARDLIKAYDEEAEVLETMGFEVIRYDYALHPITRLMVKVYRYLKPRTRIRFLREIKI